MKFEALEIGKRYQIDESGTTGVLLHSTIDDLGPGFMVDQTEHVYEESPDGLVRFGVNDTYEYSLVELDSEEIED